MENILREINGVKTYRTPRNEIKKRDISCWSCTNPVSVQTFVCDHCGAEFPDFIQNKGK
jgi:Zn finger protein HypA/HybF involved in hydrogenase expression